ncbi:MAG TPA: hypothetical protein VMJ32_08910 [Pirellulales bacterium]|nr:hypothetical protein [Pirellulales bacterium]
MKSTSRHRRLFFCRLRSQPLRLLRVPPSRRRGAALAIALVAFMAATAILFTVLRATVGHQQQIFANRQQLQAESLAQAGIARAVAKLRSSRDYTGETWHVPADQLDGVSPGVVEIHVAAVSDQSNQLHIAVRADFPSDSAHRSRQSRETTLNIP